MDFALIITMLTLASGVVWLLDKVWLRRRRRARVEAGEARSDEPSRPVEYATSFFPLLLLVLVFRSFMFEPFKIPSGSMLPTLLIGDFIVVSKYAYGLRLPVLNTKILETGEPERGDVFVFRFPRTRASTTSSAWSDCPATPSPTATRCCSSTANRSSRRLPGRGSAKG